jgi:hypothetical protein
MVDERRDRRRENQVDDAKIGRITPGVDLEGRYELCPATPPATRFILRTGMRRWPRSITMIAPTTPTMTIATIAAG